MTKLRVLDLFSGIGGLSIGLENAGMKTIMFCEKDERCRKVLQKHWRDVPVHGDIETLGVDDGKEIDVICGGFPCQDISLANSGSMRGLDGEKSGLWGEFYKQICKHSPTFVIIENSPVLRSKGLDRILNELSQVGYDAEWHCVPATAVDAPHSRDRVWVIAYPAGFGDRLQERQVLTRRHFIEHMSAWSPEPSVCRVANGIPNQSHRLRQLGNGLVPKIAEIIGHAIIDAYLEINNKLKSVMM